MNELERAWLEKRLPEDWLKARRFGVPCACLRLTPRRALIDSNRIGECGQPTYLHNAFNWKQEREHCWRCMALGVRALHDLNSRWHHEPTVRRLAAVGQSKLLAVEEWVRLFWERHMRVPSYRYRPAPNKGHFRIVWSACAHVGLHHPLWNQRWSLRFRRWTESTPERALWNRYWGTLGRYSFDHTVNEWASIVRDMQAIGVRPLAHRNGDHFLDVAEETTWEGPTIYG